MKDSGIDVVMVSAYGPGINELVISEGVPHEIIPFTRKISPIKDLYCLIKLIFLIKRHKPDIVHTHTPKAGLLGMLASKIINVPLRIHTIAGLPLMTASGFKKQVLILSEKLTYFGAHIVLPNSQSIYDYVKSKHFLGEEKLDLIGYGSTNGIDLNRFSIQFLNFEILERIKIGINFNSNTVYLLSVGRVVKDKGISELIRSFRLLRDCSEKKINLILLGPIENIRAEEDLDQEIIDEIFSDSDIIHFQWSDHVEYYMHLCDILIHASHREGFPNVLLQAGAMQCPIVCTDIPGNVDLVKDNETGLLFSKGDENDLLRKTLYAINNLNKMKEFSATLRNEIEMKFERKYLHKQYLNFYKQKLSLFV